MGNDLRVAREHAGLSLDAMAASTKVSLRQLEALEADRLDELPQGIFRKGIVRSYCHSLGLDEAKYLAQLPVAEPAAEELTEFARNVKRSRSTGPGAPRHRWIGVVLMLLVLIAAAVWVAHHYFGMPLHVSLHRHSHG